MDAFFFFFEGYCVLTFFFFSFQDATMKLPDDKPVRREDADRVISAERRNKTDMRNTPGGVASSLAAAARINRNEI